MQQEQPSIVVIGSYMHAFVVRATRFPEAGETVFGTDSEIGPGGKGQNQAIAAARLGASVSILACVGEDAFGAAARSLWRHEGLRTTYVRTVADQPTGMAFIMLDAQGQNRIIVVPGANNALGAGDADAADGTIAGARVVVAQFESPVAVVERALTLARRHKVRTVLNPAPAREVSDALLTLADVITPNESEARALTGISVENNHPEPAARALRARGPQAVVLTMGDAGAYILDEAGGRQVPGVVTPVLDTTGAGDAFTGALAVALARGLRLDDAVAFANLAGAFCVTRPGVVPGLGTEEELLAFTRA
ncbi:MAG TPA: ribokinase [Chloroflexota bacterium]|nr:ribokinase [Chloroflexota bacterium]